MTSGERFKGFNRHAKLDGSHAFLSPSNPAWLRWTRDKLIERLRSSQAAALGTELHETAERNIRRGLMMHPEGPFPVLAAYVNDAIELGMKTEQMLFYSIHCYGTADAISFDKENMFLRIHDLKTGKTTVKMDQLYAYAALFCLEYGFRPYEIRGELRIYQGEVFVEPIDRDYLAGACEVIREWVAEIEDAEFQESGGML